MAEKTLSDEIIDKHFTKIIEKCLSYVSKSDPVKNDPINALHIYGSLERDWWRYFDVEYDIGNKIHGNTLNGVSKEELKEYLVYCGNELDMLAEELKDNKLKIPTEIRYTYRVPSKEREFALLYKKQLKKDVTFYELSEKWFEQIREEKDALLSFDVKFEIRLARLVEIAYDFTGNNAEETKAIYIYTSMENGSVYYNAFYVINGKTVKFRDINTALEEKCDVSDNAIDWMLRCGTSNVKAVRELFEKDGREVPTQMKMFYSPQTGAFDNRMSYNLQFSNIPGRTNDDVFNEWFNEIAN